MMPVILSLGALLVAVASTVHAHRRTHNLESRLEAAVRESDQRLDTAVSEVTARIEAWVRSSLDGSHALQLQATDETLSQWSADVIADLEGLFASFRATVKADMAALVGQTLAEYEGRPPTGDGSTRR